MRRARSCAPYFLYSRVAGALVATYGCISEGSQTVARVFKWEEYWKGYVRLFDWVSLSPPGHHSFRRYFQRPFLRVSPVESGTLDSEERIATATDHPWRTLAGET